MAVHACPTRHESESRGVDKERDPRDNSIGRQTGRDKTGVTSAGIRSRDARKNATTRGNLWIIQSGRPPEEQRMTSTLNRRVAPVLLLVEVAYIALLTVAFTVLPPDTAELDHTAASALDAVVYAAATLGLVVALAGAAALLGLERARARAPRAVRVAWLSLVGLGQVAVAVKALVNAAGQDLGPDTAIGSVMAAAALCVAAACALEVRGAFPVTGRDAHA
ncbi:hypothetical protein ACGF5F_04665 [Streptomyces sp. NPDC047821]|uniref:hypothetical protein n=1 Tax=Streptomyces sp. NPDC047821 TaxID=3365488 RepID=UPI003716C51F